MFEFVVEAHAPEDFFESGYADAGLGVEGGGGLYGGYGGAGIGGEEGGFDPGGSLVLATLSGDHDGEGEALAVLDAIEDGLCYLILVGPEGVDGYQGVTPAMPNTNWSMAAIMTKKKRVLMRPLSSAICWWSSARRISEDGVEGGLGPDGGGCGGGGFAVENVDDVH